MDENQPCHVADPNEEPASEMQIDIDESEQQDQEVNNIMEAGCAPQADGEDKKSVVSR
jgi:hypothetical protein